MATYNNQHWLLSHIRNSFISTDDTGMCEAVMLSEDLPNQYVLNYKMKNYVNSKTENILNVSTNSEDFICYPGLLEHEDDEDALSQSYDIQMDQDNSLHRQRSNTAQKLEKMDLARRKASKIKNIKCDDSTANLNIENNQFTKNSVYMYNSKTEMKSLLSDQLAKCPKMPQNKFIEYARFDGTAQTGINTRTMRIFLTMLPEKQRNYPMPVSVTAVAKIQEFIGLICYKCSIAYPDVILNSVKDYGLFITEEDGEVDTDFPALDLLEPVSKFRFGHLALAERKLHDSTVASQTSSRYYYCDRTLSITSETDLNRIIADTKAQNEQQNEDLARMLGHTTMMEAPLYQSYRLLILHKPLFKILIQLGISGEKFEIDPVQQKTTQFWRRQKAVSHSMESVAWCELMDIKPSRAIFRIAYISSNNTQQLPQFDQTSSSIAATTITNSPLQTSSSFKCYDFETEPKTALEIVAKINNILEVKTSSTHRDIYKSLRPKDKKKLLKVK